MAHSLSVFDNNKQKMKYYEAMSWAGLEQTKLTINNEYEGTRNRT